MTGDEDATRETYAAWADTYDADVASWGYAAPTRVALALRRAGTNPDKPLLDFGCGTGLSGMALRAAGFTQVDGTDLCPEMLEKAREKNVYQHIWEAESGTLGHIKRGSYPTVTAVSSIGHGEAPPQTLDLLLGVLAPGGLLAFTLDDHALADRAYSDRLDIAVLAPDIEVVVDEDGPHLPAKGARWTVFVLRRT